jgi:rhamnose transport system ATP-binding protein
MMPLLTLTSVSKSFGAVRALEHVSFELLAGEVHALLGENGAGKSTLVKLVTGAHPPDAGSLALHGREIRHLTPALAHQLGVTCVYQQPALFPDLSVAENIALRLDPPHAAHRVRWPEWRARAARLLTRIGATVAPDTEVRALSMPEQQLVEIACALGAEARIVIMDEPTASLTRREVGLLYGVVRELRLNGAGIIYITHRLEEIFELANRVTVLRDGRSVGTRTLRHRSASHGAPSPGPAGPAPATDAPVDPPPTEPAMPGITQAGLIELMVGREISQLYPLANSTPGPVVLAMKHLTCAASGVRAVTLELRAGEILGLAGLIGAGRTELARVLFGLTPADAGELRLDGRPVRVGSPSAAVALGIAYVPEDRRRHGVIFELPIAQNITMAVHRRLFPAAWLRFGAERALALDYLRQLAVKASGPDAAAGSLSGGNQQKVALARWLATTPRVLILDEPTQGVDVGAKSEIHALIRRLACAGMAVLMISSDLPEVLGMSDRIAVMRGGQIVAELPRGSAATTVMAAALGSEPAA